MGLAVGGRRIADTRIQGVLLRPLVGGYELVFGLYVAIYADEDVVRRASITGARVTVNPSEGEPQALGFARPEAAFEINCKPSKSTAAQNLHLHLQPAQLAALEALRGTGDLVFELLALGIGTDENGDQHVQGDWRIPVARSDWIKILRDAGARNVMLLEIPLPLESIADEWHEIAAGLQRAEAQYHNGDYHSCIGSCRTVMQELGQYKYREREWASGYIDRLTSDRKGMSKSEREGALFAILRHYTHQAHHGPSEGGVPAYTRAEAQFVLSLTAATVAHAQAA